MNLGGEGNTNQPITASQRGSTRARGPPTKSAELAAIDIAPDLRKSPASGFPNSRNLIPPERTSKYIPRIAGEKHAPLCSMRVLARFELHWFKCFG